MIEITPEALAAMLTTGTVVHHRTTDGVPQGATIKGASINRHGNIVLFYDESTGPKAVTVQDLSGPADPRSG